MLVNINQNRLGIWTEGVSMLYSYGHLGLQSLKSLKTSKGKSNRSLSPVPGIVGYCFVNKTGQDIEYHTEDVSYNEETKQYEGRKVVKIWKHGEEIDLTKTYAAHLLKRPEFNCKCANATLVGGTSDVAKKISERLCQLTSALGSVDVYTLYTVEQIESMKEELDNLANELAGTCYIKCRQKDLSVHNDLYKRIVSELTEDGTYKIVDPRYIKTFGLLNNSLVSKNVERLTTKNNSVDNQLFNVLNKVDTILNSNLLNEINKRSQVTDSVDKIDEE